jgi:hypothetical protein
MNRIFIIILSFIFVFTIGSAQIATTEEYEVVYQPEKQAGFVFSMAETGSGFGGFIAWPLIKYFHFGLSLDMFFIRDSREFTYYDPYYYGYYYTVNKENNVYIFDLLLIMKYRLFAQELDESFRPFVSAAFGYIYGMNYPEYSRTPEGFPTNDQFDWTLGGFFGIGTDISTANMFYVSIRGQYRIMPFSEMIGERSNHSMFELRLEIGRRF